MISGDNIPDNIAGNKQGITPIPTMGWVFIGILIGILIIVFIIAIYSHYKDNKKIDELRTLINMPISDEERDLLLKYRGLKPNDKTVVKDTIDTLNKNHKDDNTHTTE